MIIYNFKIHHQQSINLLINYGQLLTSTYPSLCELYGDALYNTIRNRLTVLNLQTRNHLR